MEVEQISTLDDTAFPDKVKPFDSFLKAFPAGSDDAFVFPIAIVVCSPLFEGKKIFIRCI